MIMLRPYRTIVLLTSLLICLLSFVRLSTARAAPVPVHTKIIITPSINEVAISPGTTTAFNITVNNTGSSPIPLYVSAEPFDDHGYLDTNSVNWYSFSQTDIILLPNHPVTEKISVSPPATAEAGGHYATIYFTPLVPVSSRQDQTTYAVTRIGALSFVIIKGKIIEHASLSNLTTPGLDQNGPIIFKMSLYNDGNVHLLPHGHIDIYNSAHKIVTRLPLASSFILPRRKLQFSASWNKPRIFGHYSAQAIVTYGTANNRLISPSVSFWVIPWVAITAGVGILSGLGIFVIKTHRRWRLVLRALLTRK